MSYVAYEYDFSVGGRGQYEVVRDGVVAIVVESRSHNESPTMDYSDWQTRDAHVAIVATADGWAKIDLGWIGTPRGSQVERGVASVDAPELLPKYEAHVAEQARLANEAREVEELRVCRATFTKGARVRVVKGRKVPVGTEGVVTWFGDGQYGTRVGLKDASGEVHYTAASNCVAAVGPRVEHDDDGCWVCKRGDMHATTFVAESPEAMLVHLDQHCECGDEPAPVAILQQLGGKTRDDMANDRNKAVAFARTIAQPMGDAKKARSRARDGIFANRFDGRCTVTGQHVRAGDGYAVLVDGKWTTYSIAGLLQLAEEKGTEQCVSA